MIRPEALGRPPVTQPTSLRIRTIPHKPGVVRQYNHTLLCVVDARCQVSLERKNRAHMLHIYIGVHWGWMGGEVGYVCVRTHALRLRVCALQILVPTVGRDWGEQCPRPIHR